MNTENIDTTQDMAKAPATQSLPKTLVWISAALTFAAWLILLWGNGYVALGAGVASIGAGAWSLKNNSIALRRVAITSIIASTVLATVVAAYIIVMQIVMP